MVEIRVETACRHGAAVSKSQQMRGSARLIPFVEFRTIILLHDERRRADAARLVRHHVVFADLHMIRHYSRAGKRDEWKLCGVVFDDGTVVERTPNNARQTHVGGCMTAAHVIGYTRERKREGLRHTHIRFGRAQRTRGPGSGRIPLHGRRPPPTIARRPIRHPILHSQRTCTFHRSATRRNRHIQLVSLPAASHRQTRHPHLHGNRDLLHRFHNRHAYGVESGRIRKRVQHILAISLAPQSAHPTRHAFNDHRRHQSGRFHIGNGRPASWSMCWELLFSLALPVYVIIATDMRFVAPIALACVLLSEWTQWPPLRHMAMFALGVALAKRLTDNGRETMRDVVAVPLALCGIVLVCQSGFGLLPGIVAQPLAVCGCLILVVVALTCNVVSNLLSTPPVRWLGRISFSLYLTHLPVRDWIVPYIPVQGLLRPVVLFALCLLAAEAFYLAVERPATRLSRRLGKAKREA